MALEEDVTEGNTSSSAAITNQVPQAASPRGSECPICLDIIKDQASVSWCRHTFCFSCILQWSCIRAVCPICQERFQYIFHKVGDSNYEVYYLCFTRPNQGRGTHRHSAERRWHHSTGRQQHSSSSRERGPGHARAQERDQSRSPRRHRRGHSRDQQAQCYDSSSSRRRQQSWAQDTSADTSSNEDQASRPERDVPVRSGRRSEHRQRGRRATRSRSQRRSRSPGGRRNR